MDGNYIYIFWVKPSQNMFCVIDYECKQGKTISDKLMEINFRIKFYNSVFLGPIQSYLGQNPGKLDKLLICFLLLFCHTHSSIFHPIQANSSLLKHFSLFQPIAAYSSLFQPLPAYSILLQSIPAVSSLFQHIPAYSSPFQSCPPFSSIFQHIQAYSSLFQPIPT